MKYLLFVKSHSEYPDLDDETDAPDKETALKIFQSRHGDYIEPKDIVSEEEIQEDMECAIHENHLIKCKKCREFGRRLK